MSGAPDEAPVDTAARDRVWRTAWWPGVRELLRLGYDVTVLDPDFAAVESYQEYPCDGVATVYPHTGLTWTLFVTGCETEQTEDEG